MSRWHDALRAYRRSELRPSPELVFVLCAEDHHGAALAAACGAAVVLQGDPKSDGWMRRMLDRAIRRGARRIVVCGHDHCDGTPDDVGGARATLGRAARLRTDPELGELIRAHRVAVVPIYLHAEEGDVYLCDPEGRSKLLSDVGFAQVVGLPLDSVDLGELRRRLN